jgi:hypothetical protein
MVYIGQFLTSVVVSVLFFVAAGQKKGVTVVTAFTPRYATTFGDSSNTCLIGTFRSGCQDKGDVGRSWVKTAGTVSDYQMVHVCQVPVDGTATGVDCLSNADAPAGTFAYPGITYSDPSITVNASTGYPYVGAQNVADPNCAVTNPQNAAKGPSCGFTLYQEYRKQTGANVLDLAEAAVQQQDWRRYAYWGGSSNTQVADYGSGSPAPDYTNTQAVSYDGINNAYLRQILSIWRCSVCAEIVTTDLAFDLGKCEKIFTKDYKWTWNNTEVNVAFETLRFVAGVAYSVADYDDGFFANAASSDVTKTIQMTIEAADLSPILKYDASSIPLPTCQGLKGSLEQTNLELQSVGAVGNRTLDFGFCIDSAILEEKAVTIGLTAAGPAPACGTGIGDGDCFPYRYMRISADSKCGYVVYSSTCDYLTCPMRSGAIFDVNENTATKANDDGFWGFNTEVSFNDDAGLVTNIPDCGTATTVDRRQCVVRCDIKLEAFVGGSGGFDDVRRLNAPSRRLQEEKVEVRSNPVRRLFTMQVRVGDSDSDLVVEEPLTAGTPSTGGWIAPVAVCGLLVLGGAIVAVTRRPSLLRGAFHGPTKVLPNEK